MECWQVAVYWLRSSCPWVWVLCLGLGLSYWGSSRPEVGVPWHPHFLWHPVNRIWTVQGQMAPFRLAGPWGPWEEVAPAWRAQGRRGW